jgi:hypothetical protein
MSFQGPAGPTGLQGPQGCTGQQGLQGTPYGPAGPSFYKSAYTFGATGGRYTNIITANGSSYELNEGNLGALIIISPSQAYATYTLYVASQPSANANGRFWEWAIDYSSPYYPSQLNINPYNSAPLPLSQFGGATYGRDNAGKFSRLVYSIDPVSQNEYYFLM